MRARQAHQIALSRQRGEVMGAIGKYKKDYTPFELEAIQRKIELLQKLKGRR